VRDRAPTPPLAGSATGQVDGSAVTPATCERSAPASVVGTENTGGRPDAGTVSVPLSTSSVPTDSGDRSVAASIDSTVATSRLLPPPTATTASAPVS
jgi:hypothetical protein